MSCDSHKVFCGFTFSKFTGQVTIEECYGRYFEELVQSLECIVHHHDLSEDIVQNLFLELLQSSSERKVDDYRHLKRYFHLAARRRAYDWLRTSKRMWTVPLSEAMNMQGFLLDPVESVLIKDEFQKIAAFIAKQQDRNRRIFLLRIDGASVKDLSHKFGIAPVTVYAILSKIRRDLKKFLCAEEKMR